MVHRVIYDAPHTLNHSHWICLCSMGAAAPFFFVPSKGPPLSPCNIGCPHSQMRTLQQCEPSDGGDWQRGGERGWRGQR